jgi:hypothetical protein
MSFNEDGFLSGDIDKWRAEKRAMYPDHFNMLTEINQTAQGMLALTGKSYQGASISSSCAGSTSERCSHFRGRS